MKKRGSMELGISTVVVLVIAIVIIAGGIAFIRGFFSKGTEELGKAFDITDFTIQPDEQTPLVFAQGDSFSIKKGDEKTIKIGLYNMEGSDIDFDAKIDTCASPLATTPELKKQLIPTLTTLPVSVGSGKGVVFNVLFSTQMPAAVTVGAKSETDLPAGTYLCKLKATYTKQGVVDSLYASTDAVITVGV